MNESHARTEFVRIAKSIYDRGLTHGRSGNISVRVDDGWLLTPTGSNMGSLDPEDLTKLGFDGNPVSGKPSIKEASLHQAIYQERPDCGAVVHLHSPYAVALSLIDNLDPANLGCYHQNHDT